MKNKKIIIFIILFISFIFFVNNQTDAIDFKYIVNKNNIICYNSSISLREINEYILYYENFINQIYIFNNLTDKRISDQNLIIILCKESFKEWDLAKEFKITLKEKLSIKNYKCPFFESSLLSMDKDFDAIYVDSYLYPAIIFKIGSEKRNKFIFTICEYNHYLINKNEKNDIDIINYNSYLVFHYLLDEGFTNFVGFYLRNFTNKNYGNFIYEKLDLFSLDISFKIYKFLLDLYKENKWDKNILNFSFSDLYKGEKKVPTSFIGYNSVFFYSYINYFYGTNTLINLIKYIYNENYTSTDDIFKNVLNKTTEDILFELDKRLND